LQYKDNISPHHSPFIPLAQKLCRNNNYYGIKSLNYAKRQLENCRLASTDHSGLQSPNFFSRINHHVLCLSYHSNTKRFCLQSFVRLDHHGG